MVGSKKQYVLRPETLRAYIRAHTAICLPNAQLLFVLVLLLLIAETAEMRTCAEGWV